MFPAGYNNAYQILQTPGYVVILHEMIHEARIIPIDGRPHLDKSIRLWTGDPRGHWEGDTLVVETTNFNGKGWIATNAASGRIRGVPHSDALHLVERFTRVDADTINYEVTIEDPNIYTRPWTVAIPLSRDESYQMFEYACHEGNKADRARPQRGPRRREARGPRPADEEIAPSAHLQRVIDRERLTAPRADRRPRLRGRRPELVGRRQAERQQRDGAEIQAAGRDVGFADARLVAAEADPQPAIRVERVRARRASASPPPSARRAPAPARRRRAAGGAAPTVGEQMKGAAPVRERAADRGKAAVRRDQPFLDRRVALRPPRHRRRELLPRRRLVLARVERRRAASDG